MKTPKAAEAVPAATAANPRTLAENAGYVLIIARGDGKTLLLGTDNARNRLIAINSWSPLEHDVYAYRTDHFASIARALTRRYQSVSEDGFGLWFHVDAHELRAAVEEFDLETGARARMGAFALHGKAWVKGAGPGQILSLNERGAVVKLDRPKGELTQVIAPRSLMKPYLRAVAS